MKAIIGDKRTLSQRLHLRDRALEWYSAMVMIGWATALALPGNSLAAPAFSEFHRFGMTEVFWTWVFAGVGGMRISALVINGMWEPTTPVIRFIGAAFGVLSWSQIGLMIADATFMTTGVASTQIPMYLGLAIAELCSAYRAAIDVRIKPF